MIYRFSASTSSFPFPAEAANNTAGSVGGGPKAFLNWLVFDRDYNLIPSKSGFKRISATPKETGQDVAHERLFSPQITIDMAGYVYIFLSNEESSPVDVYFDDFKVTQVKSPVVQMDDYYPFGLSFNSHQRENSTVQEYKFNGKELQSELNLRWHDYGARMYQSDIARWLAIDPHSDSYYGVTPYVYTLNNPVMFTDPDGKDVDVSEMDRKDRRELKRDLEDKTGLKLKVKHGMLVYKKDKDGNLKRNNSNKTSEFARNTLKDAIDDKYNTVKVSSGNDGNLVYRGTNSMELDRVKIALFEGETSEGLNSTTMGWALSFFHEYFHTLAGGANSDPDEGSGVPLGQTDINVNKMRSELGEEYGQRLTYHQNSEGRLDFGNGRSVGTINPTIPNEKTPRNIRLNNKGKLPPPRYKYE